jgi:pimeloyl-ACP methyl ester carboxylesterase
MKLGEGSMIGFHPAVIPMVLCFFCLGAVVAAGDKPAVVLVHGAFQNAAAWSKVESKFTSKGYRVIAVNLPGRDGEGTDPQKLTTEDYKQAVLKAVSAENKPFILVGHSFGGITISNVAEAIPEKIKVLVYLSAYLSRDGQSLQALSETDQDSQLGKDGNFVVSPDYKYASIKPENAAGIFGNDAQGSDRELIGKSLIREPLAPMTNPSRLTAERFGRVPKFYIETTKDLVVSPSLQERMMQEAGIQLAFKINAGHASYVTRPDDVVEAILNGAKL